MEMEIDWDVVETICGWGGKLFFFFFFHFEGEKLE